jgi:hypothetical protein
MANSQYFVIGARKGLFRPRLRGNFLILQVKDCLRPCSREQQVCKVHRCIGAKVSCRVRLRPLASSNGGAADGIGPAIRHLSV